MLYFVAAHHVVLTSSDRQTLTYDPEEFSCLNASEIQLIMYNHWKRLQVEFHSVIFNTYFNIWNNLKNFLQGDRLSNGFWHIFMSSENGITSIWTSIWIFHRILIKSQKRKINWFAVKSLQKNKSFENYQCIFRPFIFVRQWWGVQGFSLLYNKIQYEAEK